MPGRSGLTVHVRHPEAAKFIEGATLKRGEPLDSPEHAQRLKNGGFSPKVRNWCPIRLTTSPDFPSANIISSRFSRDGAP